MGNTVWKVLAIASGLVGARLGKKATDGTWKAATGSAPPQNPADPDVTWKEAAAFAVVSGAIAGIARMVAQKEAAHFYTKSAGKLPKSLEADNQRGPSASAE